MKKNNPFTLTFGRQPHTFISRQLDIASIMTSFAGEYPTTQVYMLEGIRGSGKTVLMTSVAKALEESEEEGWIVVNLNSSRPLLTDFALRLRDQLERFPNLLERGFNLSVMQIGVGVNGENREPDCISILEKMFKQIEKQNKKILITIDEVRSDDNMREFTSQFQIFIRENHPLFLLMTGLYENLYAVQNDPALTFLLRTPRIRLEPLSVLPMTNRYRDLLSLSEEEARKLAKETKGYAFAFQALGNIYWNYLNVDKSIKIWDCFDEILEEFAYRKIWSSLTKKEREIIHAMKKDKMECRQIYTSIGMTVNSFSKYRDEMIKKGVLLSESRGSVSFALPRFKRITESLESGF